MAHNIHISDIRTFRSCRRKWDWASPIRQNLEPQIPYAPFFVGRAVHYILETYYGNNRSIDVWETLDKFLDNERKIAGNMWKSEQDKWDESVNLISEMIQHYMLWVQVDPSDFRDETLEFYAMEVPFDKVVMNIPGTSKPDERFYLTGRFDGIVKHLSSNTYWIWETKTARSINELAKSLENDEQAGAYIYAAEQIFNVPIVGVLYNILRKKAPTHPSVLQNGLLSKNKNADLSVFSYVADIKRNHPEEAQDWDWVMRYYGEFINQMSVGNNGFFARFPIRRTVQEIKNLVDNLYWTAVEMIDPETKLYPAPNFVQCSFCQFRAPCLAMNKGGNYKAFIESEFQPRVKAESMREVEL